MKTKLEVNTLLFKYLSVLRGGYENGDFTELFKYLAPNCVLESQWVIIPKEGLEAVTSYLKNKGEALKRTENFPSCRIVELVGNVKMIENAEVHLGGEKTNASIGLAYKPGTLCLLMEQTIDNETNGVIIAITLSEDYKISRIDLCMPELFQYRSFFTYVSFLPAAGDVENADGMIRISEKYYGELYLFLGATGIEFEEYDNLHIPMDNWTEAIHKWKTFCTSDSFDEAFEYITGLDYSDWSLRDKGTMRRLCRFGSELWKNREVNSVLLEGLMEWTKKYSHEYNYINTYGF